MSTYPAQSFAGDRIASTALVVAVVGLGALLASVAGSLADLVWLTRPMALLGTVGGVGALVGSVRCAGTGRKALLSVAGLAMLIAGSTVFGMSFPH